MLIWLRAKVTDASLLSGRQALWIYTTISHHIYRTCTEENYKRHFLFHRVRNVRWSRCRLFGEVVLVWVAKRVSSISLLCAVSVLWILHVRSLFNIRQQIFILATLWWVDARFFHHLEFRSWRSFKKSGSNVIPSAPSVCSPTIFQ